MNRIFATSLLVLTLAACGGGDDAATDETNLEVATPPASGEAENGIPSRGNKRDEDTTRHPITSHDVKFEITRTMRGPSDTNGHVE